MFARVFPLIWNLFLFLFLIIFIFIPAVRHDGLPFNESMIGRDNDEDDEEVEELGRSRIVRGKRRCHAWETVRTPRPTVFTYLLFDRHSFL